MKRFVNLENQLHLDIIDPKQFSFFCTVKGEFETFNGSCVWDSINEFKIYY